MKLAIVGSRDYPDKQQVVDYVNSLPSDTTVISGGARGVDTWAKLAAIGRGLDYIEFPANWKGHGKRAGFMRNYDIVEAADAVVAFTTGSKGTAHTIKLAEQARKLQAVYTPEGEGE